MVGQASVGEQSRSGQAGPIRHEEIERIANKIGELSNLVQSEARMMLKSFERSFILTNAHSPAPVLLVQVLGALLAYGLLKPKSAQHYIAWSGQP